MSGAHDLEGEFLRVGIRGINGQLIPVIGYCIEDKLDYLVLRENGKERKAEFAGKEEGISIIGNFGKDTIYTNDVGDFYRIKRNSNEAIRKALRDRGVWEIAMPGTLEEFIA